MLLRNNTVTTDAFSGIAFDVSTENDDDSIGASIAAVRDTSASSTAANHDANLVFSTNDAGDDGNTERMRITHDGLVGIGTTAPAEKLEVAGDTSGNLAISIDNDNTAGLGTFTLKENTATVGIFQYRGSTNGTLPNTVRVGSNVAGGSLAFTYAGGTTGMYIKGSDGNVGIGTTSPNSKLDVAGNILVSDNGSLKAGGNGYLVLGNTNGGVIKVHGDAGSSIVEGFGNSLVLQTVRDNDDIKFNVNKGGTDSDTTVVTVMKIDGELGHVDIPTDDTKLRFGAGQDLSIYHDGSNSYIDEEGTGSLIINSSQVAIKGGADAAENMATFVDNGAVTLYHNNAAKLATSATGVSVTGTLAATSKSFVIPHPTKENKTLRHGSLEGPEHGVYVRGTLQDSGVIELPDYWLGLVDEDTITVQLTGKGRFQRLYVDRIEDNKIYVENEKMHSINCYYFVQAERKDIDKMVVEY
tara:strand:- start:36 stop:1439 length:1404 start_codon:yes stop_codon:yes gene_type:complete